MANKEIKQRIVLEGEKEYNKAISEAQRNLKTLKSELKAETAELGKNASEQQKAEKKAESLRKQIAEQEKIVKTLREALDQAKKEYGDNADVVQKWEQKLNGARTTLANMKSDLDGVGQGFGNVNANAAQATVATKSVADALGSIGSASGSISDSIESIFDGLIDKIRETVEALWSMITETAAKANNWTDLAAMYGSSAEEVQMWDRAISAAGGSFEKFQAAITRLAYGGKEKKITELLGVSKENYQDDLEYTLAVFDAIEKKKAELGEGGQNTLDDILSEVFGARKSADVMWFINNARGHMGQNGEWVNGWRDNPEQWNADQGGYGLTSEELGTMNDVYIKLREIDAKWDAIKDKFSSGFGVATFDLMVNVSGVLDGIAEYMSAETDGEKEAALQKIRENIEGFFTKLGEIIQESIHIIRDVGLQLQESDDPLTSAIGDILVKLSEGLQWMVDHQEDVKHAFEAIFGVWLIAKLGAVAGQLSSILMQIAAIQAFRGVNAASAAAQAGATAAQAGAESAGTAASTGIGLSGALGIGGLAAIVAGSVWAADRRKNHAEEVLGTDENLAASTGGNTNLVEMFAEWAAAQNTMNNLPFDATEDDVMALQARIEELWKQMNEFSEFGDLWDSYSAWRQEHSMSSMDWSLPEDWMRTTSSWGAGENGVTSGDLEGLRGMPAGVENAAERGITRGIRGLKVEIDGQAAGRILAPYVSQEIAKDIE